MKTHLQLLKSYNYPLPREYQYHDICAGSRLAEYFLKEFTFKAVIQNAGAGGIFHARGVDHQRDARLLGSERNSGKGQDRSDEEVFIPKPMMK
ncbi:MAG: hypothetical protein HY867_01845 [Chloroflexi bacterium]|nr:hypothetical protein [Chloroflexota bacterium]